MTDSIDASETRTLTITRRDESVHVVLYDSVDADLVLGHRWYISAGYVARNRSVYDKPPRGLDYLHRVILGLPRGNRSLVGDHINGNRLDNRRANLRAVPNRRNVQSQAVVNRRGTSRFRGVHWHVPGHRWMAQVRLDDRKYYLGLHDTEEQAAAVVAAFRVEHGLPPGY